MNGQILTITHGCSASDQPHDHRIWMGTQVCTAKQMALHNAVSPKLMIIEPADLNTSMPTERDEIDELAMRQAGRYALARVARY